MLFFFDLETTGFGRKRETVRFEYERYARIVQIGWILAQPNGQIVNRRTFVIRPNGFEIPESAVAVHGITTEIAHEIGIDIDLILDPLRVDIDKADEIIAFNVAYDAPILGAEFIRAERADPLRGKRLFCMMRETKQFCGMVDRNRRPKMPSLKELHQKLFGCDFERHDAGNDCDATLKCCVELINRGVKRLPSQMKM